MALSYAHHQCCLSFGELLYRCIYRLCFVCVSVSNHETIIHKLKQAKSLHGNAPECLCDNPSLCSDSDPIHTDPLIHSNNTD